MNRDLTVGGLYRMVRPKKGKEHYFLIVLQQDQVMLLDTPVAYQNRVIDVTLEQCFHFRHWLERIA